MKYCVLGPGRLGRFIRGAGFLFVVNIGQFSNKNSLNTGRPIPFRKGSKPEEFNFSPV